MGQEIVYCFKCQNRLLGSDFERRKAFKISGKVACLNCVPELLAGFPDPEAELAALKKRPGSGATSAQLKAQRAEPSAQRIPSVSARPPMAEPPPAKSPVALYVGLGIAGIAVLLAILMASHTSSTPRYGSDEVRAPLPPPVTPAPAPSPPPARTLRDELLGLDDQVRPLMEQGQLRDAAAVMEAARPRHLEAEWTQGIDSRLATLATEARRRTSALFERALAAAKRGDSPQVLTFRRQVELQAPKVVLDEFDRSLSGVPVTPDPEPKTPPPTPAPAPPAPPTPPSPPAAAPLDQYRAEWLRAAGPAVSRNLALAVRQLEPLVAAQKDPEAKKEAEADLQDLKLAGELLTELPKLVLRLTKGQKVALEFLGESGGIEALEGTVASASPTLIALQTPTREIQVPVAELSGASLGALQALRGEKRPGDARALGVLLALDGRKAPEIPEKYAALRRAGAGEDLEPRRLYFSADALAASPRSRASAVEAFLALLEKSASPFVARNRRAIEDRLAGLRDMVFVAEDLAAAGTFLAMEGSKGETYWQSTMDSPAGRAAQNYLEAEVDVQAGQTYQAWVYAGGCCQEVFTFSLQGTGLSGPSAKNPKETVVAEPGGPEGIAVRPPGSLKKKHDRGPKTAERWEWIALGPLKFGGPGLKKLRILTEEKGFAVGSLVVSATRTNPPGESELKELLRIRPPQDLGPTSQVYREIFRDIPGGQVADLTASPKFKEGRADLVGMVGAFDSWNMGENYGTRMRGFVHPPVSGEYIFWIASDDESELYLSADEHPARKTRILQLTDRVEQRNFDRVPSQKSAPVALVAGKRYYLEVLHKQADGPEHVAVGWTLPGGAQERPIPPSRLSAWGAFPPRQWPRALAPPLAPDAPVTKTDKAGGEGGRPFEDLPQPRQVLRGFRYSLSPAGEIASLVPLYSASEGRFSGTRQGAEQEILAKPGYAVGGALVKTAGIVAQFKLIFMRQTGGRLSPEDRYESDWIGRREGTIQEVTGNGMPLVGVYGRGDLLIDALGFFRVEK